jgi:DNA-binding CsgD family transcriptional regulator/N-acetylneuraminic acid mutarotase
MAEPGEPLSEREREIVHLVATGATNRMIAQELTISPNTVKVHLRNIFTKLEISSRTEATVIAIREGWVDLLDGEQQAAAEQLTDDVLPREEVVEEPPEWQRTPLPWPKRIYVVASILVVVLATALAWPRSPTSAGEECRNEFTAECGSDEGVLALGEPESLWVSGVPIPQPRGRFGLVNFNGLLYVLGGETADGVTDSVLIYNPREDSWSDAPAKPTPASNLAAVASEGRILVFGGSATDGRTLATTELYDPATGTWESGSPMPIPLAAHTATIWNDQVYLFGGWNGTGYTGDALVYQPATDSWKRLPLLPTPRGFAGAALVKDKILVLGGYDGQREYALCESYDLQKNTWGNCPPMSTPRGGIGVAVVAGQIYVIGGGWNSFVTFSERYHMGSAVWHNVETPLLLTGGEWRNMGVITVGTRVYAIGGWQSGRYLSVNQAYETLPNRMYLPATSGS